MVFFELRWNYSPLKEKAVLLPDGLFIVLAASRQTAIVIYPVEFCLLLMRAAQRASRPRGFDVIDKICRCAPLA